MLLSCSFTIVHSHVNFQPVCEQRATVMWHFVKYSINCTVFDFSADGICSAMQCRATDTVSSICVYFFFIFISCVAYSISKCALLFNYATIHPTKLMRNDSPYVRVDECRSILFKFSLSDIFRMKDWMYVFFLCKTTHIRIHRVLNYILKHDT